MLQVTDTHTHMVRGRHSTLAEVEIPHGIKHSVLVPLTQRYESLIYEEFLHLGDERKPADRRSLSQISSSTISANSNAPGDVEN